MLFGPVRNAAHGGKADPWFLMLVGSAILVIAWRKYLKGEVREGAHFGTLLGLSAICGLFIFAGLWNLFH